MSVTDNYDDPQPVATVQMQHVNMYFSNCVIPEANISLERKEKKKAKPLDFPAATIVPH